MAALPIAHGPVRGAAKRDALSLAYSSCELKPLKDAHKAPLPLHFALPHGCYRQSETTNAGHSSDDEAAERSAQTRK
jgi:hypothetical protein